MTEKDKKIQELTRRLESAEEQIAVMVETYQACRYCKNLHADCLPGRDGCKPEWNRKGVSY